MFSNKTLVLDDDHSVAIDIRTMIWKTILLFYFLSFQYYFLLRVAIIYCESS